MINKISFPILNYLINKSIFKKREHSFSNLQYLEMLMQLLKKSKKDSKKVLKYLSQAERIFEKHQIETERPDNYSKEWARIVYDTDNAPKEPWKSLIRKLND